MSNPNMQKNDEAWESIFKKYDILGRIHGEGQYILAEPQIQEFHEPRLMVNFDHSANLPQIFLENGLSILPITKGEYILSNFDSYHGFEYFEPNIINFSLPDHLQSLDSTDIPNKGIALNCALASGIITDFLEDEPLFPTVSGSMGSGDFSFKIDSKAGKHPLNINISGAPIEIDAAYEGISSLAIIETARCLADDFLVSQLYYPFRLFSGRISKKVRPIFIVYSNGIYRLYEYEFEHIAHYNSLKLVKQKNYSIEYTDISQEDIEEEFSYSKVIDEPEIPFPQADNFERIISLCEILFLQPFNRNEVTEQYSFDVRQTNYYIDAARYLGLVEKNNIEKNVSYKLTDLCKAALSLKYKQRHLFFCSCIFKHKVFNEAFKQAIATGEIPDKNGIVQIMKESNLYRIESDSTYQRRASTIKSWLNWVISIRNV